MLRQKFFGPEIKQIEKEGATYMGGTKTEKAEKRRHKSGLPNVWKTVYRQRYLILMMLPGLIWFLIFKYCTYAGLGLAFTNYGFKKSVDFVGLRNFIRLFHAPQFWTAFKNTIIISICNIVFYFHFRLSSHC